MTLVANFQKWLGEKELPGKKNRSPLIDHLNEWIGVGLAAPYCATAQSKNLEEVAKINGDKRARPKSASSLTFRRWFDARNLSTHDAQEMLKWKGAYFGWTNPDGHGHVGLVEQRLTTWWVPWNRNRIVAFKTLEANTGPDGGRDGDGFYRRKRKVDDGKPYWYLNATNLPGGSYWV